MGCEWTLWCLSSIQLLFFPHKEPKSNARTRKKENTGGFLASSKHYASRQPSYLQQDSPGTGLQRSLWTREVTTCFPVRPPSWWVSFKQQHSRENIFKLLTAKLQRIARKCQKHMQFLKLVLVCFSLAGQGSTNWFLTLVSVQLVEWEQKWYVSCSFLNFKFARVYPSELDTNNPSELT